MEAENTLNVLLIHDEVDEANRLVSLLRNANYIVDPHYAASAGELSKKIQERNWELVLAEYTAESVPSRTVLHQIRRTNKDIPVIFMTPEFDASIVVDALKAGAADVVPLDEDQLFIQVVARTLYNLDSRRKLRYWKRRFSESEDRFENLILSSQDGIAIIKEGMYVHVNNTFARFFGYPDEDSMTLVPVFDTIARESQNEFKRYLKPLDEQDAWDVETIRFEGLQADGETLPVQATLSQIDFHGEPALQLLIKKDFILHRGEAASEVPASGSSAEMTDPGKIRLQEMVEGINAAIRKAANTGEDALLFYIQVDQYANLQKQLGIGTTEQGIVQLAHFLDSLIPDKVLFGRIREEGMVLVVASSDTEKGLALGNRLVRETSSQIFTTEDGSFSCTLSIGITPIGEATASADESLASCEQAVTELQQAGEDGSVGNGVKLHETLFEHSSEHLSEQEIVRLGRQIIKKDLLTLAYQPVVSLQGNDAEIYEVLTRVKPEAFTEGEVPTDFIGNIFWSQIGAEFDRIVIARALAQLAEKKKSAPRTRLILNLSQTTLKDDKFVPWLQKTLEETGISADELLFQMREIDVSRHLGKAAEINDRLRNLNAHTILSHFGLSINPMTILNKLSADIIRVDGVLVEKAQKDKTAVQPLTSLIDDLKERDQKVIVPHLESAGIIPALWQARADYLQGHYIKQPGPEMDFDFSQD